jgi:hypothetical protein
MNNTQLIIEELRFKEDVELYFENIDYIIQENFEDDTQEFVYEALEEIFEDEELNFFDKSEAIHYIITEVAAKSCQEGRWKRPNQISWAAREPNSVTWGKGVNNWFETFPGKGKETR